MSCVQLPSHDFLVECFTYNPKTGELTWKRRPLSHFPNARVWKMWNTQRAGKRAGCLWPKGYWFTEIQHVGYLNHRIIWKLVTGQEPSPTLDHRNRCPGDNRWKNLREATNQQNSRNALRLTTSRSGFRGVYFKKTRNRFYSFIVINGNKKFLGSFLTAAEAHQAYMAAAKELHGEFFYDQQKGESE